MEALMISSSGKGCENSLDKDTMLEYVQSQDRS